MGEPRKFNENDSKADHTKRIEIEQIVGESI